MKSNAAPKQMNNSRAAANGMAEKRESASASGLFLDTRPEAIAQRKLQDGAYQYSKVKQRRIFEGSIGNAPITKQTAQGQDLSLGDVGLKSRVQPVQRISKTGYLSFDSWENWDGTFKHGAEAKWKHLVDLYSKAAKVINAGGIYPEEIKKSLLDLNAKAIGFSEYDKVLGVLNDVHAAIDRIKLDASDVYLDKYVEQLKGFYGKTCPFIESKQISFDGSELFKADAKAVLCKVYNSEYGKTICDHILKSIENPEKKHTITFEPGAESEAVYDPVATRVSLNVDIKDYASGTEGDIIPNTLEIVIVHELGHLLNNISTGIRGTPKTPYSALNPEAQSLWSNEEEYINITQIENKHRKSLDLPARLYHSGDPLIHLANNHLKFIFDNHEELNMGVLKKAGDGDTSILLTPAEQLDFVEIRNRMKADRIHTTDDVVNLRTLIRKHLPKINALWSVPRARGVKETTAWEKKGEEYLLAHADWKNKLIPLMRW